MWNIIPANCKVYSSSLKPPILSCRYTIGLFIKGYKKELDVEDIYNPLNQDRSKLLGGRLQRQWEKELKKAVKGNYDPSLLKAIVRVFWTEGMLLGVLLFISDFGVRLNQPRFLGGMLDYFRANTTTTKETALYYAGAMVAFNFINMIIMNHYMVMCFHFGMKLRVASCAIIYRKVSSFLINLEIFLESTKP